MLDMYPHTGESSRQCRSVTVYVSAEYWMIMLLNAIT